MRKILVYFLVFFSYCFAAEGVSAVVLAKSHQSWDSTTLPSYPLERPEISVLKITIPPHTQLPMHQHPIINVGYMVKGALKVITDENKTLQLKAGDAIIEVVNRWHYGVNEDDEPVEIVVVYAGTQGSAYSIQH